jgi:hypothetical protein
LCPCCCHCWVAITNKKGTLSLGASWCRCTTSPPCHHCRRWVAIANKKGTLSLAAPQPITRPHCHIQVAIQIKKVTLSYTLLGRWGTRTTSPPCRRTCCQVAIKNKKGTLSLAALRPIIQSTSGAVGYKEYLSSLSTSSLLGSNKK